MTLQEATPLVEQSISGLGIDPATSHTDKPGHWSFKLENSTIWIDVYSSEKNEGKWYFQVMSPLCSIPSRRKDEFLNELLEINFMLYGSWIAKKDGWAYVTSLRETANLDQSEIDATLDRVVHYSTEYREKLRDQYSGCWDKAPQVLTGERV
jgi:hypothetical protein